MRFPHKLNSLEKNSLPTNNLHFNIQTIHCPCIYFHISLIVYIKLVVVCIFVIKRHLKSRERILQVSITPTFTLHLLSIWSSQSLDFIQSLENNIATWEVQYLIVQLCQSQCVSHHHCPVSMMLHRIKHRLSSLRGFRGIRLTHRSISVRHRVHMDALEALFVLVVMHSSNSPCSRPQDIGLAIPPDLTYDAFPLLQPLSPFQLLSRSKHVHTECPI